MQLNNYFVLLKLFKSELFHLAMTELSEKGREVWRNGWKVVNL